MLTKCAEPGKKIIIYIGGIHSPRRAGRFGAGGGARARGSGSGRRPPACHLTTLPVRWSLGRSHLAGLRRSYHHMRNETGHSSLSHTAQRCAVEDGYRYWITLKYWQNSQSKEMYC